MKAQKFSKIFNYRLLFQKSKLIFLPRFYSENSNMPTVKSNIKKVEDEDIAVYKPEYFLSVKTKYWNEGAAIRKEKKMNSFIYSMNNVVDLLRFFQKLNDFPGSFSDLWYLLKKRHVRNQLIEQKYLPRRVAVLKPDLAAAHFILRRGGSVKFKGSSEWIGYKEKKRTLPMAYVPGIFIEAMKAEGTNLYVEGLPNISQLLHLSFLSLKNLDTVNDWFLDVLSQQHSFNLEHLDISGCKNVTYRGLSCFYRFENLKVLEVKGIPDTTEFKLACLMLFDIMPSLDIRGIDLSIPIEIKPANVIENIETLSS